MTRVEEALAATLE
jgi:hypothetical protein